MRNMRWLTTILICGALLTLAQSRVRADEPCFFTDLGLTSAADFQLRAEAFWFDEEQAGWQADLLCPFADRAWLHLSLRDEERYTLRLAAGDVWVDGLCIEIALSNQLRPGGGDGFFLGFSEVTHPAKNLWFFARCYPCYYFWETDDLQSDPIWLAGMKVGGDKVGLSLGLDNEGEETGTRKWLLLELRLAPRLECAVSYDSREYWGLAFRVTI